MSKAKSYLQGSFKTRCRSVGSVFEVYPAKRRSYRGSRAISTGSFVSDTINLKGDWDAVGQDVINAQTTVGQDVAVQAKKQNVYGHVTPKKI